MVDLSESSIVLDEPFRNFAPGDVVTGNVAYFNYHECLVSSLQISWKREAKTCFGTTKNICKVCQPIERNDNVEWSPEHGKAIMPSGRYSYPFAFKLPETCGPTFKSRLGSVEYAVYIVLGLPDISFGYIFSQKKFRVVEGPVSDKTVAECVKHLTPVTFTVKENGSHGMIGNMLGKMFPAYIRTQVTIPKSLFYPGETVKLHVTVVNSSTANVSSVNIRLNQHFQFGSHAACPHYTGKTSQRTKTVKSWSGLQMEVLAMSTAEKEFDVTLPDDLLVPFPIEMCHLGYSLHVRPRTKSLGSLMPDAAVFDGLLVKSKETCELVSSKNQDSAPF